MAQIYRIYVNDKRIIISSDFEKTYPLDSKKITEKNLYSTLAGMLDGNESANFVLLAGSPRKIMEELLGKVHYLEAGGGLVRNGQGQYLFIFRHGKWDLPKGKLEADEAPREGSIREVTEECNIEIRGITRELEPTWHAYLLAGRIALKKTYWYLMEAGDDGNMRPQAEEGITQVRWFFPQELDQVHQNTYALIREMTQNLGG